MHPHNGQSDDKATRFRESIEKIEQRYQRLMTKILEAAQTSSEAVQAVEAFRPLSRRTSFRPYFVIMVDKVGYTSFCAEACVGAWLWMR